MTKWVLLVVLLFACSDTTEPENCTTTPVIDQTTGDTVAITLCLEIGGQSE